MVKTPLPKEFWIFTLIAGLFFALGCAPSIRGEVNDASPAAEPTSAATAAAIHNTGICTNGSVSAMSRVGNLMYVGGNFTQVGACSRGALALDMTSGESEIPVNLLDQVAGTVSAVLKINSTLRPIIFMD